MTHWRDRMAQQHWNLRRCKTLVDVLVLHDENALRYLAGAWGLKNDDDLLDVMTRLAREAQRVVREG